MSVETIPVRSSLFGRAHAVIGVVHLAPLPGSAKWDGAWDALLRQAESDVDALVAGGVDAVIVENYGDVPFAKDHVPAATVAAVTAVVTRIESLRYIPFGLNILRNDATAAVSIAVVTGARFVRVNVLVGAMVTDQGLIEGCARELQLLKRQLGADQIEVWADVLVKHAAPLGAADPIQVAKDTLYRGGANALIVSGTGTGEPVDPERLRLLRQAGLRTPLLVGSGARVEDLPMLKPHCDGFIVATNLKDPQTGRPDVERVRAFVDACRQP